MLLSHAHIPHSLAPFRFGILGLAQPCRRLGRRRLCVFLACCTTLLFISVAVRIFVWPAPGLWLLVACGVLWCPLVFFAWLLAAFGGLWRRLPTLGGPWRSGALGVPWRPLVACGVPWHTLAACGDPCRSQLCCRLGGPCLQVFQSAPYHSWWLGCRRVLLRKRKYIYIYLYIH